jgi:hypothetical protein
MAHNHGNEYQVKIVHADGTEELSGWMNNQEQVAQQAMAAVDGRRGKAYWLRERNVLCPNCLDSEQRIVEYPLTDIPSPRCSPHDSRYLLSVGSRDRYALAFTFEESLFRIMVAVADSHPAGVTPDFGGQKEKAASS